MEPLANAHGKNTEKREQGNGGHGAAGGRPFGHAHADAPGFGDDVNAAAGEFEPAAEPAPPAGMGEKEHHGVKRGHERQHEQIGAFRAGDQHRFLMLPGAIIDRHFGPGGKFGHRQVGPLVIGAFPLVAEAVAGAVVGLPINRISVLDFDAVNGAIITIPRGDLAGNYRALRGCVIQRDHLARHGHERESIEQQG